MTLESTLSIRLLNWGKHVISLYIYLTIDWEEKAHDMRQEVQNKSVHAVVTSTVFNRVHDEQIPNSNPQQHLKLHNVCELVNVNDADLDVIRSRYKVILVQLMFKYFTAFEMFKQYTREAAECCKATKMKMKSEVVTMPVLMKDEKKYTEVVNVLDQLEQWTHEIYAAAGLCSSNPVVNDDPTPNTAVKRLRMRELSGEEVEEHQLMMMIAHCYRWLLIAVILHLLAYYIIFIVSTAVCCVFWRSIAVGTFMKLQKKG